MTIEMANADACPKVSLLVPIYNVERYLRECLQSAAAQTLTDIEVICINDGSTDGSRAIIEEFLADPRFRVIDKENSGYGASMNQGLRACRGEYVGILESDDFLSEEGLETLYRLAKADDADVVKSDFYLYWSVPKEREERFGWVTAAKTGLVRPRDFTDVFYLKPSIWSALYKRSFLEENDICFLETPGASYQDAGFNFKVWAMAERAVLVDEAFLRYRQDNEASSVNSPGKVYCVCDEYAEMIRYLDGHSCDRAFLDPILVKMRYDSYMWNYDRLSPELRQEFVWRMAEDFRREDEAGLTDYDLFESWKEADRKAIMDNPQLFHIRKMGAEGGGKLGTLRRCYQTGGVPLVMKIAREKLGLR